MAAIGNTTSGAMIARRHVLYVEGYDPQGAEGYHNLFERSFKRFLKNWPIRTKVGALEIDSDDFAHWDIAADGPNWSVHTWSHRPSNRNARSGRRNNSFNLQRGSPRTFRRPCRTAGKSIL